MAHESRSHAILSASSSHRWLNCPPSAKLNAERSDVVSEYAKEGTCAHELAEYKLRKALGQSDKELHEITENLDFFDSEMDDCTDSYADFVLEQLENSRKICPDTLILIEQKLDFSEYVPDGFGTGDCVIVADGTLQVIDFKYGLGVLVSAEKNSQMMLYALGALAIYRDLYDIEKVRMTIFQPRRENVSDWTISVPELLDWAKKLLFMYIAQLIFSKCHFCTKNQVLFRDIPLCFSPKIDFLMAIVQNHEKSCPNCKNKNFLREIKSRTPKKRSFIYIAQSIFQKCYFCAKIKCFLEKFNSIFLSKSIFCGLLCKITKNKQLNDLICKPKGKPTLVPEADKRPKIDVFDDFKED